MKRPVPIRIDEQDLKALAELGIKVPELVREAIKKELEKSGKICKLCGGVKHG